MLPALLERPRRSSQPDAALAPRCWRCCRTSCGAARYLALLDEQPAALARLVDVVARSALLAERLAAHPLLLDELLDARVAGPLPGRDGLLAACAAVAGGDDDAEAALQALNEVRQALSFRIAHGDARRGASPRSRQRAAAGVAGRWRGRRACWRWREREVERAHGRIAGARFAVLGYGSLGGEELGFGSDLDLVFLYDAPPDARRTPTARARSTRRAGSRAWRRRSWRCSAP